MAMDYNFPEIEQKWQKYWAEHKPFKADNTSSKPKFYVLDMFPYPSGAGLHVGHPLGYIASDIYSRYMRHKGFNVLHPMGYDAFGLPAEQYAIKTGQHPAITTENNIKQYRRQLDKIGFSFDWEREVRTCNPSYYKWTQWTFIQLFNSWYNKETDKAEPISRLVQVFKKSGNSEIKAACAQKSVFSADDWNNMGEEAQQLLLMNYRLAYLADEMVNWCPALGTVLANDEVSDGYSVRGGHPVERKLMKQWLLRITAYAERLLQGLEQLDWAESLKEIQRNWIGKSVGATLFFDVYNTDRKIEVFTTRADTLFGATFIVLAPEHALVPIITTPDCRNQVEAYINEAKNRSDRERMTEVKRISGAFTGAYAINPVTGKNIPVWIGDYVLAGYGTGAVMAVPGHDARDYAFARHFDIPVLQVIDQGNINEAAWEEKTGKVINSDFINGMEIPEASSTIIDWAEKKGIGYRRINYRLRDAIFSRQRYWGEPFPVYYKNGIPYMLNEDQLPLELPPVDKYLPTESGEPPLARAQNWKTPDGYPLESNTMPGFAGSSGYYLRYMDPQNNNAYFSADAVNYWKQVDLYIGGAEHATGHLIYSRFWNKFLFDLGMTPCDEPFAKLINQGMIQGRSSIAYRLNGSNLLLSAKYANAPTELLISEIEQQHGKDYLSTVFHLLQNADGISLSQIHLDVNMIVDDKLDLAIFHKDSAEFRDSKLLLDEGEFHCIWQVEKMSKSLLNVVNPDIVVERYGADTLRLYEMFLGPLEMHKPWDTKGIEGVYRFLRKVWRLCHDKENNFSLSDADPTAAELKTLHKTIKKINDDIERFSFNTAVSALMICVNELTEQQCNKKQIIEKLVLLLSPLAPHLAEELWEKCGHSEGISYVGFPVHEDQYLAEDEFEYPVMYNGKLRYKLKLSVSLSVEEIEKAALSAPEAAKYTGGNPPKKIIVVPKRVINVVV
jgi:leucyl-tRNA synthetase